MKWSTAGLKVSWRGERNVKGMFSGLGRRWVFYQAQADLAVPTIFSTTAWVEICCA